MSENISKPAEAVLMKGKRPDDLIEAMMREEATHEAMINWLSSTELTESDAVKLVDLVNAKAQPMMYSGLSERMLEFGERAFLIASHLGYERGKAESLLYIAINQWLTSNLGAALKNLLTIKDIFSSLADEEGWMKALVFEACVYRSMGDLDQSYLDLLRCVEFFRGYGKPSLEAMALVGLALTCEQIGDDKGVLRYNRRIIKVITEPEEQWMVGRALDGIGTVYSNSGRYQKAIEYYEKSLDTCRRAHHPVSEARALNDLGTVYQKLGDTGKARHYYHQSLKIRKDIDQKEAQCTCLFNLGKLSLKAGESERSLEYFNEALSIATDVGTKLRISQAHENLSIAYELAGDCVNALQHHKLFHTINEEVSREQSNTRVQNLKTRLELDKAEKLAKVERLKNTKLSEKNIELKRLLTELQEAQAQLVQAEKMAALGKLVAGIAHEINSPIGASSSSIDISQRCIAQIKELIESCCDVEELKSNERLKKLFSSLMSNSDVVSRANERIGKIVRSLKSFANLDEASFQKTDIHVGLDSTITLLEAELNGRICIRRDYGELRPIGCYPGELNQVFLNLLTNSIEAIHETGEILVKTASRDNNICIQISDNGVGIPEEKLMSLFDLGFGKKEARVKAQMGLFISHNIIQKHRGQISVESEVSKGTTCTVLLPTDLQEYSEK